MKKIILTIKEFIEKILPLYIEEQIANRKTNNKVLVPFMKGKPGIGKSSSLKEFADILNRKGIKAELVAHNVGSTPMEKFSGIPEIKEQNIHVVKYGKSYDKTTVTEWALPGILQEVYEVASRNDLVIWLLDDIHLVNEVTAGYLFEVFTERTLQGYKIPDNVVIVAAGNFSEEAGSRPIPSPVINRMAIIEVETSPELTLKAEIEGRTLDAENINIDLNAEPVKPHKSFEIFLNCYKTLHGEEDMYNPFTTPRSLMAAARVIERYEKKYVETELAPEDLIYIEAIVSGHISPEHVDNYMLIISTARELNIDNHLLKGEKLGSDFTNEIGQIYTALYLGADVILNHKEQVNEDPEIIKRYEAMINKVYNSENSAAAGIIVAVLTYMVEKDPEFMMEVISSMDLDDELIENIIG